MRVDQTTIHLATTPDNHSVRLADLLDGSTIEAFQEGIVVITGLATVICDDAGRPVIRPSGLARAMEILRGSSIGSHALSAIFKKLTADPGSQTHAILRFHTAAIELDHIRVGLIVAGPTIDNPISDQHFERLVDEFDVAPGSVEALRDELSRTAGSERTNCSQIVQLMAEIISKLAAQALTLRHREIELDTVHTLADLLAGTQDLQFILDTISKKTCEVMGVKASSIRLLNEETRELQIKSVHNLSDDYLNKGAVMLEENPIDRAAFAGQAVYVADAVKDPRIRFREQAAKEGIVSGLSVGMTYRGQTIGVMRVYTDHEHVFTAAETALLRSIASQATSAIINSRLYLEALQAERYQQQLRYAGEIQRRMIPANPPHHAKVSFVCIYEPTSAVGGDFFDFYSFAGSREIGLCIADVVGKGIPAALMMASLRTALRLYVYSIIEITEIMTMINIHMTRETLVSEFATLFYGLFSENGRKLTYCCAGHEPPLHCRGGNVSQLSTNDFLIGVDPDESFSKKSIALRRNDVLLFYTDGLIDAHNFEGANFGRQRLIDSLVRYAEAPAHQIAHNIIWDIRRFVGLADQADDITMVVAKIQ